MKSEKNDGGGLAMSLDNQFYTHPDSSDSAIEELVSKYEEKSRLLIEKHTRELHEALQEAHKEISSSKKASIHVSVPSSKVYKKYDLSRIGSNGDESGSVSFDAGTVTDVEANLDDERSSDTTDRVEKQKPKKASYLSKLDKTKKSSSNYVTEEQFTNEIDQIQEEMRSLSQLQAELQNLITDGGINQTPGLFQRSPDAAEGFSLNPIFPNNARDNSSAMAGSRRGRGSFLRMSLVISNGGYGVKLEDDTFSMMMITTPGSKAWFVGVSAFCFQIVLGVLIFQDLFALRENGNLLDVPFRVTSVVYVGQVLSIALCLATQTDILTSIRALLLMGSGSNWAAVVGVEENDSILQWILRIGITNVMKFVQGVLVTLVSLIIIIQADNIIDLLKVRIILLLYHGSCLVSSYL
uniref:Uncharacterized protein n=1 Tax=Chaetoceros debilis TaxID=122233 RepID=A0A7S3VGK8_9STRA